MKRIYAWANDPEMARQWPENVLVCDLLGKFTQYVTNRNMCITIMTAGGSQTATSRSTTVQTMRWFAGVVTAGALITSACQVAGENNPVSSPTEGAAPLSTGQPDQNAPTSGATEVPPPPSPGDGSTPPTSPDPTIPAPVTPGPTTAGIEELISDMTGSHEALMHGVPEFWSWAQGPDLDDEANDPGNFRAMTAWGVAYEAADGNPATNSRVQITDHQSWLLDKAGTWTLIQSTESVEGSFFAEDFNGNSTTDREIRTESTGGVSVLPGQGYNFHFWPTGGRAEIDPNDVAGVITLFRARTVLDDPNGVDDRDQARFVAGSGGDWWLDQSAPWDNFTTNSGLGQGKSKLVKPTWRTFAFHTLTEAQLRSNPPPFVASADSSAVVPTSSPAPDATTDQPTSPTDTAATLPSTGTVRIMTLGDSITEGNGTDGDQSYRGHLFNQLVAAGLDVDFVGTQSKPTAAGGDPDHEGHGGFVIGPGPSKADDWAPGGHGNLYDNLATYLSAEPDVVFVMAGVNDYFNIVDQPGYDPDRDGAERLVGLADRIQALRPGTLVVVSTLLPVEWSDDFAAPLNQALAPLVAARDGVELVDAATAPIPKSGFLDGVHLNDSGAAIAADTIAQQLIPILTSWREPSA